MNRHLPVFCYGTLRPGCGNHSLWVGRASAAFDGAAFVVGYKLTTQGYFPYLVPAAAAQTCGTLIYPDAEHYDAVIERMDALEGVPYHYNRIQVPVVVNGPAVVLQAWTYVPTEDHPRLLTEVSRNEDGFFDWHEHVRVRI